MQRAECCEGCERDGDCLLQDFDTVEECEEFWDDEEDE